MFLWLKSLITKADMSKPTAERQLVLLVLIISLLIAGLLVVLDISRETALWLVVGLLASLVLALRGYIRITGIMGPLIGLVMFSLLLFRNLGIRDTALLGLPAVIIAASLLNGKRGVVAFGAACLLVVLTLGVGEFSGRIVNPMSTHNTLADYLVVGLVIVLTMVVQMAVINRLDANLWSLRAELDERQRMETALRASEEALRTSEQRYRTFITQSTEGIRRYDMIEPMPIHWPEHQQVRHMLSNMYIAECNDAFAQMYGLSDAQQLIGRRLEEMGIADDDASLESLYDFIRSGYRVIDTESREIGPDGRHRVFMINTIGVIVNGCLVRVWGAQRDVTEKKQAEEEVHELNIQLEERVAARTAQLAAANREMESFSYSISHDLRAPLRAIQGFGNILRSDFAETMGAEGRELLDKILAAAREMDEKIHALLAFSQVVRSAPHYVQVNLSQIAETVLARLHSLEPQRKVACLIEPGLYALADQALMQTLLENLLDNAWKYSSGNPAAEIEFGISKRWPDGKVVYKVRDNGIGFDMRHADRLFGAFQRLHGADEFPGHGIGLATVKKIVERHDGAIWAEAAPGKGATFYFTLGKAGE